MNEMQVSVERVDNFTRRLNVTVPISQLDERKKQHLLELAKKARLDGFRPGKVPLSHIEKLYGNSIWQEVIEKSLQISLLNALKQKTLNPVRHPHIDSIKAEPGTDLTYTASFEIFPHVEAPTLKGMKLERLEVNITEGDIAIVLEQMRKQYVEWIEISEKADYGDKVSFDIIYEEEENTQRDLHWILEKDKTPEEFSVLLHSIAGDTFPILLPEKQETQETKQVNSVTIKVKKVARAKLPELDDAFAKRLDIKEGTLKALKAQVRDHMQIELDRVLREKIKAQVIDKLVVTYAINELPKGALNQEFQRLEQAFQKQHKQEDKAKPLSESKKVDLMKLAHRRVTIGLLFNALVEKHHLHVDESRVKQHIDNLARAFQFDQMARDKFYKDNNLMMSIRSSVLEEQAIDKLLEEVEYTEKVAEYSDCMNLIGKNYLDNIEEVTV
jgi:trigger factor